MKLKEKILVLGYTIKAIGLYSLCTFLEGKTVIFCLIMSNKGEIK